jgi:hypothetical protein
MFNAGVVQDVNKYIENGKIEHLLDWRAWVEKMKELLHEILIIFTQLWKKTRVLLQCGTCSAECIFIQLAYAYLKLSYIHCATAALVTISNKCSMI